MRLSLSCPVLGLALSFAGCAAQIGDECSTSVDCSPQGDRICDVAQISGYCTIKNCSPDACPDDALCVQFGAEPRFERTYCMATCSGQSDCRDHYECTAADGVDSVVIDERRSGRYCAPSE